MAHPRLWTALLSSLILTACRGDDISVYHVPKDSPGQTPVVARASKAVTWTTPPGWIEQPPSDMRLGSFLIKGEKGQQAEVSIIPLMGEAGGDLANINRWRGQIGLGPLEEKALEKESRIIAPAGRRIRYVDFANGDTRVVAGIYTQKDRSWFFKMMGDASVVAGAVPAFKQFLSSVKLNEK